MSDCEISVLFDERGWRRAALMFLTFCSVGWSYPPAPLPTTQTCVRGFVLPPRKRLPFRLHLVQCNNPDSKGGGGADVWGRKTRQEDVSFGQNQKLICDSASGQERAVWICDCGQHCSWRRATLSQSRNMHLHLIFVCFLFFSVPADTSVIDNMLI